MRSRCASRCGYWCKSSLRSRGWPGASTCHCSTTLRVRHRQRGRAQAPASSAVRRRAYTAVVRRAVDRFDVSVDRRVQRRGLAAKKVRVAHRRPARSCGCRRPRQPRLERCQAGARGAFGALRRVDAAAFTSLHIAPAQQRGEVEAEWERKRRRHGRLGDAGVGRTDRPRLVQHRDVPARRHAAPHRPEHMRPGCGTTGGRAGTHSFCSTKAV
jgi:hypothetical protein